MGDAQVLTGFWNPPDNRRGGGTKALIADILMLTDEEAKRAFQEMCDKEEAEVDAKIVRILAEMDRKVKDLE